MKTDVILRPDNEDDDGGVGLAAPIDRGVKLFVKRLDGTQRPMRADEWELERLKLGLKPGEEPVVVLINPAQPLHEAFEQALAEINELQSGNGSGQYLNRITLHELYEKVRLKEPLTTVLFPVAPPQPPITYIQAQRVLVWVLGELRWSEATVVEVDQDKQLYKIQTDAGRPIRVPFEMSGLLRPTNR